MNDAPTLDLPDSFEFSEDGTLSISFSQYIDDIDEDQLVLSVSENENIITDFVLFRFFKLEIYVNFFKYVIRFPEIMSMSLENNSKKSLFSVKTIEISYFSSSKRKNKLKSLIFLRTARHVRKILKSLGEIFTCICEKKALPYYVFPGTGKRAWNSTGRRITNSRSCEAPLLHPRLPRLCGHPLSVIFLLLHHGKFFVTTF